MCGLLVEKGEDGDGIREVLCQKGGNGGAGDSVEGVGKVEYK